jgi:hypothetical protein
MQDHPIYQTMTRRDSGNGVGPRMPVKISKPIVNDSEQFSKFDFRDDHVPMPEPNRYAGSDTIAMPDPAYHKGHPAYQADNKF